MSNRATLQQPYDTRTGQPAAPPICGEITPLTGRYCLRPDRHNGRHDDGVKRWQVIDCHDVTAEHPDLDVLFGGTR